MIFNSPQSNTESHGELISIRMAKIKTQWNSVYSVVKLKTQTLKLFKTMNKQEIWKKILNIVITVLTAIATTFGVSSCMNLMQ